MVRAMVLYGISPTLIPSQGMGNFLGNALYYCDFHVIRQFVPLECILGRHFFPNFIISVYFNFQDFCGSTMKVKVF